MIKASPGIGVIMLLLFVGATASACASEPGEPIYLPSPAPATIPAPAVAPTEGIEQAADDYTDAVVAQAPDALYDLAVDGFKQQVDRQTFVAAWKRCNAEVPEHYDVLSWTAQGTQAVVVTNADGARGLLELTYEDGRWMWQPPSTDVCP